MNTNKKFWFWNNSGKLIVGNVEFATFEDARQAARAMNRDGAHATLGYVEVISDAKIPAHGRVTTVDAPMQRNLFL